MNRRDFLGAASAGLVLAAGRASSWAQGAPSDPAPRALAHASLPPTDEGRIAELVAANHILADQGVLDGFGHVSCRSAANPGHYWMSRSLAPASVTAADILEFDADSRPVDARGRDLYGERFIHGEIYRARPDVMAVAHSHTPAILPFGLTRAPLKAAIHTAYFLGTEPAPVFDIRDAVGAQNLMLVNTTKSGAALARTLGARAVVLLRGHGMAVAAPSIRDAVGWSIYTAENAQVEAEAFRLGQPVFMNRYEVMRVDPLARQWDQWAAHAQAAGPGR